MTTTTILRVRHPHEDANPWINKNSFASLAEEHADKYAVRDLPADAPLEDVHSPAAMCVRVAFNKLHLVRWALSQPAVCAGLAAGIPLVIDDSEEASLSHPAHWESLKQVIHSAGVERGRFIWLQQNELGPQQCAGVFKDNQPVRVTSLVFHYWLHRVRLGQTAPPTRPDRSQIKTRFLCLNHKLREHRAVVLGWLSREGLLDRGLVSMMKRLPGTPSSPWPSFEDFERVAAHDFPGFENEISASRELCSERRMLGGKGDRAREIPWGLHAQTGFSLLNESEMEDPNTRRFTEKTLKAVAAWHPIVLAGNVGTLQLLRDYGFKTFSPWIDESYDLIEPPPERMRAVLAEAKRLISMPDTEFSCLLDELDPVLEHNHRHFMDGLPAVMEQQHAAFHQAVAQVMAG